MHTLLTSPSFLITAAKLTATDLHKQLIDCLKIGRALQGKERPEWREQPGVLMWYGSEQEFWFYALLLHHDWLLRFGKGNAHLAHTKLHDEFALNISEGWSHAPWLKDSRLHRSHQSALIRRNPKHYSPIWPDVPNDLPMFWPTLHEDYGPHFYNV